MDSLNTLELDNFLVELNRELDGYLQPLSFRSIMDAIRRGEVPLNPAEILRGMGRYLFDRLTGNLDLLGKLIILSVLAAVLANLQSAFENETIGKLAYSVVYLVLVTLAAASFYLAFGLARGIINDLVSFMLAVLPLLLGLMAGVGALVSAGLLHPLMIAVTEGVAVIARDWVFPLIFLAAALEIAGGFTKSFPLSGLAGLVRQSGIAVLGVSLTVFLGVVTVQGAAGAVVDGAGLRTAKFLAGTFVPVVGGFLADAAELVVGSSLVVKNVLGVVGLIVIFTAVAFPLLKIVALVFVYRLAGAIIQPIDSQGISNLLNQISSSLLLIAATVAAVGTMFFIAMAIMVGVGNVAVMMR